MRVYKTTEFISILKANGYKQRIGGNGSHMKFTNRSTRKSISIPTNKSELNPALTEGIIKRNHLVI